MSRIKLYLYSEKKSFGEKLARYVGGQHHPYLEVELLTERKDKTAFQTDACVVSDNRELLEHAECQTIRLVKEPEAVGEREIFMYQSRESIYRQLLQKTGQKNQSVDRREDGAPRIICVFSPEERTEFALQTSAEYTGSGSVLYVSFCGIPIPVQEELGEQPQASHRGVSELMLCEDEERFAEKLGELACMIGKIAVLAPAEHFRDLFDFAPEEVVRFVQHLKRQRQFDTVVIETGHLYEFTFSLLSGADEILAPQESGFFAEAKRRVLKEYFYREGQDELWQRIRFVPDTSRHFEQKESIQRLICGEEVGA